MLERLGRSASRSFPSASRACVSKTRVAVTIAVRIGARMWYRVVPPHDPLVVAATTARIRARRVRSNLKT